MKGGGFRYKYMQPSEANTPVQVWRCGPRLEDAMCADVAESTAHGG